MFPFRIKNSGVLGTLLVLLVLSYSFTLFAPKIALCDTIGGPLPMFPTDTPVVQETVSKTAHRAVDHDKWGTDKLFEIVLPERVAEVRDSVSGNTLSDASSGSAFYIHPETGELVTVPAGSPLVHPTYGITGFGAYTQVCQYSEDPINWSTNNVTTGKALTGVVYGPFNEIIVTDDRRSWDKVDFFRSVNSGSPTGKLYFSIRYNQGTSGKIYVEAYDATIAASCQYLGDIGSATITQQNAGTLTIFSDEYNASLGYYIIKGSMEYTNLTNTLYFGIGPNSTDNSTIKIIGADVSEDRTILDFHVPSSGGNVSIASRAGTTTADSLSSDFPKLYGALEGFNGNDAAAVWEFDWTPGVDIPGDTTVNAGLLSCTTSLYNLLYSTTGSLRSYDATNIAELNDTYVAGTTYPVQLIYGPHPDYYGALKMQIKVKVNGVWQESSVTDFDGSFDPDTALTFFLNNSYQNSLNNIRVRRISSWR